MSSKLEQFQTAFFRFRPYLILLFIPPFFAWLFSYAFSPLYVDDIPFAVYDQDNSQFSRQLIEDLDSTQALRYIGSASSSAELEELMLQDRVYLAVALPEHLAAQAQKGGAGVAVYINGNNFLIGNNAMLGASLVFNQYNLDLRTQVLQKGMSGGGAQAYGEALQFTDRMLYNPQLAYLNYLLPVILLIILQQTMLVCLVQLLIEQKQSSLGLLRWYLRKRLAVYLLCSAFGCITGLMIMHLLFDIPFLGSPILAFTSYLVFMLGIGGLGFVISACFRDSGHAVQFVLLLPVPILLTSGYAWPEYMMIPLLGPLIRMFSPLWYAAEPFKSILLKGWGWTQMAPHLAGGAIFAACWLSLGVLLYKRSCRKEQVELSEEVRKAAVCFEPNLSPDLLNFRPHRFH